MSADGTLASAPSADAAWPAGVAGRSVEGRPIGYEVHGHGAETVLIIATIHGDEAAGTPLVERLSRELAADPARLDGRRVVLVPVANPDGLARGRRRNANGVDLNRDFPAANRVVRAGPSAPAGDDVEPETAALLALMERYPPDRIVSIHQPLSCIDHDGPAGALAQAMAATSRLRVRKLGARNGSLGSYAGVDRGVPVITVELPGGAQRRSDADLWEAYGAMLMTAVSF